MNKKKSDLDQIFIDMDLIDLEQDAPILFGIGKQHGYLIPDNYFEALDIGNFKRNDESNPGKLIPMVFKIAASLLLIVSCYLAFNNANSGSGAQLAETETLAEETIQLVLSEDDFIIEETLSDEEYTFETSFDEEEDIDDIFEASIDDYELTELIELL